MTTTTAAAVRKAYRELYHLIRHIPKDKTRGQHLQELRTRFRQPLDDDDSLTQRLAEAHDRAAFLRITTVKTKPRGGSEQAGRWIYKDGQKLQSDERGTLRDGQGRVVSNWDGKNLDPESVKRHRQQLNRAGFVNNSHAKGIF